MPIYKYLCCNCLNTFEITQKINEEALKECPKCKKLLLTKVPSASVGFHFKGTGFYSTDYK